MIIGKNNRRKTGILHVPRAFLFLSPAGDWVLKFSVNMVEAFNDRALRLVVGAYTEHPDIKFNVLTPGMPMGEIASAIRDGAQKITARQFRKKKSRILFKEIDLSSDINNAGASAAKDYGLSKLLLGNRVYMRLVTDGRGSKNDPRHRTAERIAGPGLPAGRLTTRPDAARTKKMLDLLGRAIDPTGVFNSGKYAFPIKPPELKLQSLPEGNYEGFAGSKGSGNLYAKPLYARPIPKVDRLIMRRLRPTKDAFSKEAEMTRAMVSTDGSTIPQQVMMYTAKLSTVPFVVPVTFSIRDNVIENMSRVFFEFNLMSSDGIMVDRIIRRVNISEVINSNFIPLQPPTVGAHRMPSGQVAIMVTQNDPAAVSVDIYKRIVDLTRELIKTDMAGWVKLGTVRCPPHKTARYLDRQKGGSMMTTMYRGIAVSRIGARSGMFGSAVLQPLNSSNHFNVPSCIRSCHDKSNSVVPDVLMSIVPNMDGDSVTVRIDRVTPNIRRFDVLVRDIVNETGYRRIISHAKTGYRHSSCHDGHIYEYITRCVLSDGTSARGRQVQWHKFMGYRPDKVKTRLVSQPARQATKGDPRLATVEIGLGVMEAEEHFSDIVASISSMVGAKDSFTQQINDMRSRYSELMRVIIVRKNLTTGEECSFGDPSPVRKFVDSPLSRRRAGVPDLRPGHTYEYTFILSRVSIADILGNVTLPEKDEARLLKFVKNESRFGSSGYGRRRKNTTPSDEEMKRAGGAKGGFSRGQLLNIFSRNASPIRTSVKFSMLMPQVHIDNITASFNEDTRLVMITWTVDNPLSMVDSFVVMADIHGIKAPVGAVMPTSETTQTYSMRDTTLCDVIADRVYTVIPVYNNFTLGEESRSTGVRIINNLSPLEGVN